MTVGDRVWLHFETGSIDKGVAFEVSRHWIHYRSDSGLMSWYTNKKHLISSERFSLLLLSGARDYSQE